ncbi:hypothetical protein ABWH89_05050 [Hoeflea alexandrii]|uniref:hypothetical protein n=1 Tax=Hoeflea alexandrii TaxID=288436 RepID=UPI0035CF1B49
MSDKPTKPATDPKPAAAGLRYVGPVSTLDLPAKAGKPASRPLVTGETYSDLPADHPIVNNLIERKLLVPVGS